MNIHAHWLGDQLNVIQPVGFWFSCHVNLDECANILIEFGLGELVNIPDHNFPFFLGIASKTESEIVEQVGTIDDLLRLSSSVEFLNGKQQSFERRTICNGNLNFTIDFFFIQVWDLHLGQSAKI